MRGGRLSAALAAVVLVAFAAAVPAEAALRVAATTTDLAALARAVGGELVAVETIIPPAVDPEAFEPRPGDIERIRGSALVLRVGLGFDYWLDKLLATLADPRLKRGGAGYADASLAIPLLEVKGQAVVNEGGHAHGLANPHYLLDPANAEIVTANLAEALMRALPAETDRILANRAAFLAALDSHLAAWQATLRPYAGAKLIAYHNSWPYFARRFRLDVIGFIEPKEGVAPSPAHLAELIALAKSAGVRAILHEPYEPQDASRMLAARAGIPFVLLATSVGSRPEAKDFFALFDYDVAAIAKALGTPSR